MQPLYHIICMAGVLFILYFGAENVMGTGWCSWDVAAFTTFLSCYTKLSYKASKSAKLFNAVHRAQVSWRRIKPFLSYTGEYKDVLAAESKELKVKELGFSYAESKPVFEHLSFTAEPGQIIGITGPVACGKSTLGKTFLCEHPYTGSIKFGGEELSELESSDRNSIVGFLGHNPELLNESIADNILMGEYGDITEYLRIVCLEEDVKKLKEGVDTLIGSDGIKISGGQAKRVALARTFRYKKPVMILDDPFSALDRDTEQRIFLNMKEFTKDSIVLLISHRLYLFPELDRIIWMNEGKTITGTHEELLKKVPLYAELYYEQKGEDGDET